jgi:hypothetical protein
MNNKSRDQDYTVTVILRVDAVTYTGKVGDSVKKTKEDVVVKRGKCKLTSVRWFKIKFF